jgi:nucleoside-diphosphate-sugar epimerase
MGNCILITGATGFIGSGLSRCLLEVGDTVRGAVRASTRIPWRVNSKSAKLEGVVLHDRSTERETDDALQGVQIVVHLAARVHVMVDDASNPLQEFQRVNADWTERLAARAASQGVRRFVYLSSVKVNGEQTVVPFTEQDSPNPQDSYGVSKWEAEQALARVSTQTGMETVVVRSPLVYGPGVRGNFLQLLNILRRGMPLPLAGIRNQRSLVYLGNLVDALARCIQDPRAAGQTYLVRDGEDLSTPELIRRLSLAMESSVCLWPCPASVLYWMGQVAGKRDMIDRLVGSLQVNSSKIQTELDWHPPFSVDAGLSETAAWFRARTSSLVGVV